VVGLQRAPFGFPVHCASFTHPTQVKVPSRYGVGAAQSAMVRARQVLVLASQTGERPLGLQSLLSRHCTQLPALLPAVAQNLPPVQSPAAQAAQS
jgi:hypothetical protein